MKRIIGLTAEKANLVQGSKMNCVLASESFNSCFVEAPPINTCSNNELKRIRRAYLKVILLFFFLANVHFCFSQCPEGGKTKSGAPTDQKTSAFNKRKNKSSREPAKEPKPITFSAIKSGNTKKDDRDAWYEGAYVEMTGAYLVDYKQQGGESCNCYEAEDDKAKGDIHINVATKADMNAGNNNYYVVIEITPSYKKLHPDFLEELKALKGKKIVVRGYLFYDSEHERNSVNYCDTCSDTGVWRKTCWEIHPVTYIAAAN